MLALRLVSCIFPQASRTFVAWPECSESIISFILNTFSCSSRQPTSSNRFVGSSLLDQTMTTFYSDLCCSWICLLECVSWCHLWNLSWLHSLFPSYCLWSFSLLFFSKVRQVFKKYRNFWWHTVTAKPCRLVGEGAVARWFPNQLESFRLKLEENKTELPFFLLFLRLFPMSPNW